MPNVRSTSMKKYKISSHRFMELYHFCMQYQEWKLELMYVTDSVKSLQITDMPITHSGNTDTTQALAMKRLELQQKIDLVENTAKEADAVLFPWIIMGVTEERMSFDRLDTQRDIPCGKDMYYDRRRKFYWLLSQKI